MGDGDTAIRGSLEEVSFVARPPEGLTYDITERSATDGKLIKKRHDLPSGDVVCGEVIRIKGPLYAQTAGARLCLDIWDQKGNLVSSVCNAKDSQVVIRPQWTSPTPPGPMPGPIPLMGGFRLGADPEPPTPPGPIPPGPTPPEPCPPCPVCPLRPPCPPCPEQKECPACPLCPVRPPCPACPPPPALSTTSWIIIVVVLFFLGMVIGFMAPRSWSDKAS